MKQSELKEIIAECVKETVEEGLFDRLKSRVSGLGKSYKYGVKGALDSVDAKVFKSPRDAANAKANKELAKNNYEIAKIKKYKSIASKKLENVAREIVTDLDKMGISKKGISEKQINFFKSSLEKSLDALVSKMSGEGAEVRW
jgi:TRAP-type mannitol/chloroaromatic compound transport system substrate-binding protein